MSRVVVLKLPPEKLATILQTPPSEPAKDTKARPKRPKRPGPRPKVEKVEDDASRPVPKASLGAVNASLRALDTSGAPCRRWKREPIQLKSFSGYTMSLPAWTGGAESQTVYPDKQK